MESTVLVGHAPVDVVVQEELITRALADLRIALTAVAGRLAAAIVIADEIVLAVMGIVAGSDPGNR